MNRDRQQTLVTVFGGTGFLGRQIVRRLARSGYRMRVATRKPSLANSVLPSGDVGQIAVLRCDVRDEAQVARAVEGAAVVINAVGILSPSGGRSFKAMHVEAAANIASAAAKAGVERLIHISSIMSDTESRSAYSRTKAEGEAAVRELFPAATVLRPSIVFGQGDGFFNRAAGAMRLARGLFPLFGGGKSKFQPVFVGDVADAVANTLKSDATKGRTYELGGPAVYTLEELLRQTAEVTERKFSFVSIPFFVLNPVAMFTGWLPFAPITYDQAKLLRKHNVVKAGKDAASVGTLADLGVKQPTALEAVLPSYLYSYRPAGQYTEPRNA